MNYEFIVSGCDRSLRTARYFLQRHFRFVTFAIRVVRLVMQRRQTTMNAAAYQWFADFLQPSNKYASHLTTADVHIDQDLLWS